jgi:predicted nucleic acid-binding protein
MANRVLIASSFLYALHDQDDIYHEDAITFAAVDKRLRVICDLSLVEVAYLLRRTIGQRAALAFLDSLDHPQL